MRIRKPAKLTVNLVLFFFLFSLFSPITSADAWKRVSAKIGKTGDETGIKTNAKNTENNENNGKPKKNWAKSLADWVTEFPTRVSRSFKKGEDWDPEALRQIVSESKSPSFTGNAANRLANAGITYPLKQVAQGLIDKKIGIIKSFVSNNAISVLKGAMGGGHKEAQSIHKAVKIAENMTPSQRSKLNKVFASLPGGNKLQSSYPQMKSYVKNRAIAHKNPALIGALSGLLNAGIYDGLDINGIKDKLIPPSAISSARSMPEYLMGSLGHGVIVRELDFVLDKSFEKLYTSALKSTRFGGSLTRLDTSIAALGKKIFKADRLGLTPAQAGGSGGSDMIKKLGLVGVGAGSRLTLKSMAKALFKGVGFGIGLQFIGETFWDIAVGLENSHIIGGNRNRRVKRVQWRDNYFQKTGNKYKDWIAERKVALRNRIKGYRKWPITRLMGAVGGYLGGTMGAVVAGALFVGGGPAVLFGGIIVSALFAGVGSFVGAWLGSKLDRSKKVMGLKKMLWAKQAERKFYRMFIRSGRFGDTPANRKRLKELARQRILDIERIEKVGRSRGAIKLVRSLDDIKIVQQGPYLYMRLDSDNGGPDMIKATRHYDFIDAEGNRGQWDPHTGKIISMGKTRDYSGKSVVFVSKNDMKIDRESNEIKARQKGANFDYIEDLGVYMQKINGSWEITGLGSEYDVVVAETGERFEFKDHKLVKVESLKEAPTVDWSRWDLGYQNDYHNAAYTAKESGNDEGNEVTIIGEKQNKFDKLSLFRRENAIARQYFSRFKMLERAYEKAVAKGDPELMSDLLSEMKHVKKRYDNLVAHN